MGLSVFDERSPFLQVSTITAADAPTFDGAAAPAISTLRLDKVFASTDDTSDVELQIAFIQDGGNVGYIATTLLPAGSGFTDAIPAVDLLTVAGLHDVGLVLPPGAQFRYYVVNALTAAKQVVVTFIGGYI